MFQEICVPSDNSAYSNRAAELAVSLGVACGARITGTHVYAARMHDYRFKQMEFTLPEEYLQEKELERQRKIHDSLITMGLELISDSYLDSMDTACKEAGLEFERKMMDGKHYEEMIKDINTSSYDLTILGAHGIGKVRDSGLGSVTAQVTRHCNSDMWIIKEYREKKVAERDTILVALDGSPKSFGGLRRAMMLARMFGKKLDLISVYDPYLHYSVFNGIVGVLSEKAKKVFRFEEQNQLHEEIIDTGLASIYQSHLNVAESIAQEAGFEVKKTLLDGKAFQKILDHARETEPWLLVLGRSGVHSSDDISWLGNTTENLLRLVPCDVFLNCYSEIPKLDLKADEAMRWTDEAKQRMNKVPHLVRGIARTAILRMAMEQGHSVITDALITEAMEKFMPKFNKNGEQKVVEAMVFDRAGTNQIVMCNHCGVTAKDANPVICTVCGAKDFQAITQKMVQTIVEAEGGIEEEASYDGRKLKWSKDARVELRTLQDKYQRRRAKARIEKTARMKRFDLITVDHVRTIIEEELGNLPIDQAGQSALAEAGQVVSSPREDIESRPVVGHDADGVPVHSTCQWNEDALTRLMQIPAGFMRDRNQERVEAVANGTPVNLDMVEAALEEGRRLMAELLEENGSLEEVLEGTKGQTQVSGDMSKCPFHQAMKKDQETPAINEAVPLRLQL